MLKDPQYPEARPFGSAGIRKPPSDKEPRPSLLLGIRRMQKPEGRQGGEGRGKARSFPAQRPARLSLSLSATPVFLTSAARRFPHLTMPTMPTRVRSARPRAEPAPRLKQPRRVAGQVTVGREGTREQRCITGNRVLEGRKHRTRKEERERRFFSIDHNFYTNMKKETLV